MAKARARRKKSRGGGKKHGKVTLRWPLKFRGKNLCDPWVVFEVPESGTRVKYQGGEFLTRVLTRIRQKHTECLAWFVPRNFLSDVARYVPTARVVKIGMDVLNPPSSTLPDEEAWLF